MTGYSDLLTSYEKDLTVPVEGNSYPHGLKRNKQRPGGGCVQDLTRFDDPSTAQALNLPQGTGQRGES